MATIETRLAKGGAVHKTELTMDWTGVTADQLKEWAARTVVITAQRVWRDAGKVPAKEHMKVKDFMDGKGRPEKIVTPEKVLAAAEKMDPKELAALIEGLRAKANPKR